MTGQVLETVRKRNGVSQLEAARLLGLSQPMLSHMETGKRNVSHEVARHAVELWGADPTALRSTTSDRHSDEELAAELGALGYPGFAHMTTSLRNPAELLFDALDRPDLDARTTEGLPWLVLTYSSLAWGWLVPEMKLRNRQNRLGFVVSLATNMARHFKRTDVVVRLEAVLLLLEDARLVKEDTLCQESWPPSRKERVRSVRSRLAAHWNLDTRLSEKDLDHYALSRGSRS